MLKEFLQFVKLREIPHVDNWVCKLYYPVTTLFFFLLTAVITQGLFFKDAIKCWTTVYDDKILPRDVINSYCWIHSTYTPKTFYDTPDSEQCSSPATERPNNDNATYSNNYYSYYQWGYISLFFQGLIYIIPRIIWVKTFGNETKRLVSSLDKSLVVQEDQMEAIRYLQAQYDVWKANFRSAALTYLACETLNLVTIVAQFALINAQFQGEFINYGIEVVHNAWTKNYDCQNLLYQIFPRVAQCKFPEFTKSGSVLDHYATCVLPINALNTKIYAFLWFWLSALIVLAAFLLLYRLLSLPNATVRSFSLIMGQSKETSKWLGFIVERSNLSVWFALRLLQKNLEEEDFDNLVRALKGVKPEPQLGDTFEELEKEASLDAECWSTSSRPLESPMRPRSSKWSSSSGNDQEMVRLSTSKE